MITSTNKSKSSSIILEDEEDDILNTKISIQRRTTDTEKTLVNKTSLHPIIPSLNTNIPISHEAKRKRSSSDKQKETEKVSGGKSKKTSSKVNIEEPEQQNKTIDEVISEIEVKMDHKAITSKGGEDIMNSVKGFGCRVTTASLNAPYSIEWHCNTEQSSIQPNKVLVRLTGDLFLELLISQNLYSLAKKIRTAHPTRAIVYIIENIADALKQQKKQRDKAMRSSTQDSVILLDNKDVERVMIWLQVEAKAHVRLTSNISETTRYMESITMELAATVGQADGDNDSSVYTLGFCPESVVRMRVSSEVQQNQYTNVWLGQLRQISGISYPIARAIAKRYSTCSKLLNAYDSKSLSEREKEQLLADIVIESEGSKQRKLGSALSSKIYRVFSETDGNKFVQDL